MDEKESIRKELQCTIHPVGYLETYKYVVVCSYYKGQWLLSRHEIRDTWETQGGHVESGETPMEAAKRELYEESGVSPNSLIKLTSMCYVRADCFSDKARANWAHDTYVIPEYSFAFECNEDISISREHTEILWLTYAEAMTRLTWDSNKTALYEIHQRLINKRR